MVSMISFFRIELKFQSELTFETTVNFIINGFVVKM